MFTFECDNRFDFNHNITEISRQYSLPLTDRPIGKNDLEQLRQEGCELVITAGYRYKVPDLSSVGIKGINIHPTLLPVGRGPWPLPWTILSGQQRSGVTIHKLTPDFDAGDILVQREFALEANENLESLSAKTQLQAKAMLTDLMDNFTDAWQSARPQGEEYSAWPRPSIADRTLDWNAGVAKLDTLCRAFGKMGCYGKFDGKIWIVYRLVAWPAHHDYESGAVVHQTNTEMIVAAAEGLVSLQYFEPASLIAG
ncbi:MAG: formyltransferase family protein [Gammaproteobacteria bacterium]|nr:formyltransferase family protein [Gammaproteobacteria bacterium]